MGLARQCSLIQDMDDAARQGLPIRPVIDEEDPHHERSGFQRCAGKAWGNRRWQRRDGGEVPGFPQNLMLQVR